MEQNVSTEKKSSEVIVVTSGKGGVGKTTTSANVGTGLAKAGSKVCLIDTDIGLRNLDVVMGLENRIVYNLVDVVEGNCRIKQALIRDKRHPGLYLMPSAQTRDKSSVTPQQMKKLTQELTEEFDYVILDTAAGMGAPFTAAATVADKAFVQPRTRGESAVFCRASRIHASRKYFDRHWSISNFGAIVCIHCNYSPACL